MTSFTPISNAVLVGLVFISLICTQPAQAKINPADGQRLKTIFTQMIERYSNEAKMQGGQLVLEGDVMVEPSDTYFAITLPHITAVGADQSKINLGMISINALPGDKKEEWKMTVAMPTPITLFDLDGKQSGTIKIGSQNAAGVFHETFKNFVRLNAQYKNITYTDTANKTKITIPDVSMIYDLKEGADNLWSGPMSAKATGILATFGQAGADAKIREVNVQSSIKGYSITEALAYQEKLQALLESLGTDNPSISGQHAQGVYNTFFDFMTKVWDGFSSSITLSGIEVITPPTPAGKSSSTVKIDRIGMGLEGDGFRKNSVTMRQTLNMSGLSMTPPPTGMKKAAPDNINIDLTLTQLPFKELVELGQKTLSQSTTTADGKGLVAMNGLASMQQLLTNAGTTLAIKETGAGNAAEYSILLNGTATANIKAIFGATSKARLEVFGIDKLIAYAQQAAADPTLPADAKTKAQGFLQTLTMLQMIGQQSQNARGQPIRSYDVELTADGKTLLNGADLMSVMGGAGSKTAP